MANGAKDLSIALIGFAGALIVGNFAIISAFLSLTSSTGDQVLLVAFIAATITLVTSVYFGGAGIAYGPGESGVTNRFNLQVVFGLMGLAATLTIVGGSWLFYEEPAPDRLLREVDRVTGRIEALEDRLDALDRRMTSAGVVRAVNRREIELLRKELQAQGQ